MAHHSLSCIIIRRCFAHCIYTFYDATVAQASLVSSPHTVGERFAPLHEAVSVTARAARLSYNTLLGNNFQLVFLLREAAPALASAIEGSSLAAAAAEEVLNRTAQVSCKGPHNIGTHSYIGTPLIMAPPMIYWHASGSTD